MPDVRMPQLGESVTEGTIGKWLKQVGDRITKYEPLAEVITDKVNAEIPADVDGILTEILVQEGETVSVGTIIAVISDSTGQTAETAAKTSVTNRDETVQTVPADRKSVAASNVAVTNTDKSVVNGTATDTCTNTEKDIGTHIGTAGSGRFSPVVMRLLQEHKIDPKNVTGTGLGGRITRKDVYRYLEHRPNQQITGKAETGALQTEVAVPVTGRTEAKQVPTSMPDISLQGNMGIQNQHLAAGATGDQIIPASAVRKTIAKRMVESKQTAPHAWTMVETDVTSLAKFRAKIKDEFKRREGIGLTYLPFFIKAVTEALKEFPMINSTWSNDSIIIKKDINISIAVATDDALVVPVIHHADRLSITGIAHAIHDLATRARAGKLTIDDIQGGTFTVNNTGAFGSILSAPIINSSQAAILTMEAIVKRPVVLDDDAIAIRSMVNLCLSLDHRVLDGFVCGRFLQSVKQRLQEYGEHTIL